MIWIQVVDDISSALDETMFERKSTINANNRNMCRFADAEDDGYVTLRYSIIDSIEEITEETVHVETG